MSDPRVVDSVMTIEAIRRQRRGASGGTAVTGYADGGYTGSGKGGAGTSIADLTAVAAELRATAEAVKNIRSYVVYQDIEKAGQVLTSARAPFTRKR